MERGVHPLVSIGVPVFNGESGITRCLDGLLAQDYSNLEILISDNASTDATPAICERYARMDPRVKYWRSERNRGATWNFNRVVELSSGKYFMWAAHDDEREPSFVSACVEQLEKSPDAVLCQTHTAVSVEGHDGILYLAHLGSFERATGIVERYQETLKRFPATALYGLYRSAAMRKTRLFRQHIATDMAFIQELSIHGRFIEVPKTLFTYRARKTWNTIHDDARAFFVTHGKPWWYLPFAVLFVHHSRRLMHAPIPLAMKLRLWSVLSLHEARQAMLKTFLKTAGALCPEKWKSKLGHFVYWRWMHSPNVEIVRADLFFERVCKPRLGWWR